MKLAINYSSQASRLLTEGRIYIDIFKCPDWEWMIDEAIGQCPVSIHFTLTAGDRSLNRLDWENVSRLLKKTNTPFVNLHLESRIGDFPEIPADTVDPSHHQQVFEVLLGDVQLAIQHFGPERVIIENVPYRGISGKVLRPSVETKIITAIQETTGCGLLLDISHARMAAKALGMDEKMYMIQLPVSALRELHFTGLHQRKHQLQDHLEILDTDWPVLDWVLERVRMGEWARPWMLAFEYGGEGEKFSWRSDPDVIERQVPRLYEKIKNV
jgi:uncharacterized protein (UPF0276 family)